MSEAENNQETNGTANGDVPEIELIIKEENINENTNDMNLKQPMTKSMAEKFECHETAQLNVDLDEKENRLQLEQYEHQHQQPQQHKESRTHIEKGASKCKEILGNRQNDSTTTSTSTHTSTTSEHVLTLTRHDNQHFFFEFVPLKEDTTTTELTQFDKTTQSANIISSSITTPTLTTHTLTSPTEMIYCNATQVPNTSLNFGEICSASTFSSATQNDDATSMTADENRTCYSLATHLDFADMVAEACEGLFDEIENDLRTYEMSNESANTITTITTNTNTNTNTNNYTDTATIDDNTCNSIISRGTKKQQQSSSSANIQLAVDAVLDGRMSLGEAAKRFNVVRSTVWSRVSKHPKRRRRKLNSEMDQLIQSKLMAGVQISEISRLLHVPKSTVHMHKTRLKNNGMLPSMWIRNGSKDMVDHGEQERLRQAYRGHIVNGMSVRFAAEFFSLPLTTLWRYIKRIKGGASKEVITATEAANEEDENEFYDTNEDMNVEEEIADVVESVGQQQELCIKIENTKLIAEYSELMPCKPAILPNETFKVELKEPDTIEQMLLDELLM